MSKTIGLTTYSISVRDENNHQYELHDILGWSLIEYFETIANEEKGKYEDDHIKENLFAFNEVFSETIEDKHGKAQYDILFIRTVLSLDSVSSIELPTTVERQHMNVTRA